MNLQYYCLEIDKNDWFFERKYHNDDVFETSWNEKKNIWHRIYSCKLIFSRIEFEFSQYQINFSSFSYFTYNQSTYSSRQNSQKQLSSFKNVIATKNHQKFSQNDTVYQKNKISIRFQKNVEKYNQQNRFLKYENNQNT